MPNYQQGKIYTIRCRTDNAMIYVGSTTQSLAKRWGGHKKISKEEKQKNRLIYQTINDEWNNWYIELYELYPCDCRNELERKEGEIIRLIGNLNVCISGRTRQEYYADNKDKEKERHKKYCDENKDKKNEYYKKYYDENKDKKNEYGKIYLYENNKIITCICGCNLIKNNLNRHLKTKRHLDLINAV